MLQKCPECGDESTTCQDHFHQMLFWEAENPELGKVHHLMVLCYHLQHPSLYSAEGLTFAKQLLIDFVENGITPGETRKKNQNKVDSGNRTWKVTGNAASRGTYENPVHWTMTAADVIAGGATAYCENIEAWAKSIREAIKVSGN